MAAYPPAALVHRAANQDELLVGDSQRVVGVVHALHGKGNRQPCEHQRQYHALPEGDYFLTRIKVNRSAR